MEKKITDRQLMRFQLGFISLEGLKAVQTLIQEQLVTEVL